MILQKTLVAIGANAVSEGRVGMSGDVAFNLIPVPLIVPDFLAPGANGEQAAEGFNFVSQLGCSAD